ncbi:NuoM family protein [Candidatus Anaplasma sp. TIGMIC]|uniref:complex I subunit 4 family protein n=1 Tax=Candidatus Anaplasma sp. TIGMIC TaxID=3020713 RepID=UPI002330AA38|nr:NADH-quinone oxidoreductase subunit M [Candidatus Anaplasma sp. TIGMIC]MDB1135157.1 NADH-quinone oxidoreductase subunit M [Candidatus Anaplasma sp. TIGMIC]
MIPFIILAPVVGACVLAFLKEGAPGLRYSVIVVTTMASFIASLYAIPNFYSSTGAEIDIIQSSWVGVHFAIDRLSLSMIVLSTFLFFLCAICGVFSSACGVCREDEYSFFALILLLESLVLGVFSVHTSIMFYVFFEASLIPMFFMIGFWGHGDKIGAAFKFLIYTATASLLFLIALVYSHFFSLEVFESFYRVASVSDVLPPGVRFSLWAACFFAFAVKLPMVPWHTWLPKAHVQAPTLGSVLLAGLLIKMGGYGFLRFCISAFPDVSLTLAEFVVYLSAVSLIYSSLVAYAQKNMKTLIAYSSVAHMGLVSAGIFSLNESGILGAVFQMISHGLISAALFLCVGIIYSRAGTLEMSKCGGLASSMPKLSSMMIFFSMASVGLPGTSGFVGEFLSILGIFQTYRFAAVLFAVGVVLSAAYMLRLCREVIWGSSPAGAPIIDKDINTWELYVLGILAALVLLLGILPYPLISFLKPWVSDILHGIAEVSDILGVERVL